MQRLRRHILHHSAILYPLSARVVASRISVRCKYKTNPNRHAVRRWHVWMRLKINTQQHSRYQLLEYAEDKLVTSR